MTFIINELEALKRLIDKEERLFKDKRRKRLSSFDLILTSASFYHL